MTQIKLPHTSVELGGDVPPALDPKPAPPIIRSARSFFADGGTVAGESGNFTLSSSFFYEPVGVTSDAFTWAVWSYQVSTVPAFTFPQIFQFTGNPSSTHAFFMVSNSTDNNSIVIRGNGSPIKQYLLPLGNLGIGYVATGNWIHHMVTWQGPGFLDDEGDTFKWYINGTDITSQLVYFLDDPGTFKNEGTVVGIGGGFVSDVAPGSFQGGWPGYVSQLAVWNKVLNADHANALIGTFSDLTKPWNISGWDANYTEADAAALLHYWPFSDESNRFRDEGNALKGIQLRRVNEGRNMKTNDSPQWSTNLPAAP